MGNSFQDATRSVDPALARALARVDALVDWERRDRSAGGGRSMRVDLGPISDLCRRLGGPERASVSVHVAGTKGKGSTAALVAAGIARTGRRVGLYTSPHVERVHERVRIDGREIDDLPLAEALGQALAAREAALAEGSAAQAATWFDVFTAAAFVAFRAAGCDWTVVECGLGGRLDSTNVLRPALCVITRIEREHAAILGDTVERIAGEKSGILFPGAAAVTSNDPARDPAGRTLRAEAARLGASLWDVPAAREGSLEARNTALACAALERLAGAEFGLGRVCLEANDVRGARMPGRLERRIAGGVSVVLDGAHVPGSLRLVLAELATEPEGSRPLCVVLGCGRDKDAAGLLKACAGRADRVLCTSVGVGPVRSAAELAAIAQAAGLAAEAVDDPTRALSLALEAAGRLRGRVLVTGSLHLVGALRSRTEPPPC